MSDGYVPMPMTCHPHYAGQADVIRGELHHKGAITVAEMMAPLSVFDHAPDEPFKHRVLTVRQVAGPAPYVGDPRLDHRVYYWFVAIDDLGRHVAGEVELSDPMLRHD